MIDLENYWNPIPLLPYQRHFIFVNSIRNTGKTYTLQWYFIKRALEREEEFVYTVRTQNEVLNGAFEQGFEKVLFYEYPDIEVKFDNDLMWNINTGKTLGHCRAVSQAIKMKKQSFPKVKFGMLDEYMLEPKDFDKYVKGWNEPDYLLNMYHTIDREEDRVYWFFLGNNTSFYNPYHLHPAFNIPEVPPGKIWMSENVLFQHYQPSQMLMDKKSNNKFLNMIKGTQYGAYALEGEYIGDTNDFIWERPKTSSHIFTVIINGEKYGVWGLNGDVFISKAGIKDISIKSYLITKIDMVENAQYDNSGFYYKFLKEKLRKGRVFYDNAGIKAKVKPYLEKIM